MRVYVYKVYKLFTTAQLLNTVIVVSVSLMRAKSERISFSQNPILRSASLTGSIHEMTDDVRRISLDRRLSLEQANLEEDLDQGCLSSSALNSFFSPFCVLTTVCKESTFAQSLVIFAT